MRSSVTLGRGTTFQHNTAQHCGNAMATVADLSRVQINTTFGGPVPLVFPSNRNMEQTLCIMQKLSARKDFMQMRLA